MKYIPQLSPSVILLKFQVLKIVLQPQSVVISGYCLRISTGAQVPEGADAVVQVGYDSKSTWNVYAFRQETLSLTGNRSENGRIGAGGRHSPQ